MSEALFIKSYSILDDPGSVEDESVSRVEALVREAFPDISPSNAERLVLDILMAHHHKRDPRDASMAQKITTSVATPVSRHHAPAEVEVIEVSNSPSTFQPSSTSSSASASPSSPSTTQQRKLPFDQLRDILGEENSDEDIERVLAHNDFHLERAVAMLSGKPPDIELSKEQMAARIMCRYFLSGSCIRGTQCMYSHDGSSRVCRFWLHQKCLMGDNCIFMHEVPESLAEELLGPPPQSAPLLPSLNVLPSLSALPTLGQKASKKKQQPQLQQQKQLQQQARSPVRPKLRSIRSVLGNTDRGSVPLVAPRSIPWVATNEGKNAEFVELRLQAATHAEVRNKLLLESTTAWSLNDAARAKQLSAKGREAEIQMIDRYRRAAGLLWEHQKVPGAELWLDLHGLDLIEAINELEASLEEVARTQRHMPRAMYVITGRGHFKAKKYADQLSQYVLAMLDSNGYKHRDFGVDTIFGRITAIDPWSSLK